MMNPIDRASAAAAGLKRYFTGEPCVRGHISERNVSNNSCVECKREGSRKWRAKNKQHVARYNAEYREANAGKISLLMAEYRKKNASVLREKDRQTYYQKREERLAQMRDWKINNQQRIRDYTRQSYQENKTLWKERRKNWAAKFPERIASTYLARRARKRSLRPAWFGEFDALVAVEAADISRRRTVSTGFSWHVDHMIPLAGREATGFHCGLNLQVIPALLNTKKGNKMLFTEPLEWLRFI